MKNIIQQIIFVLGVSFLTFIMSGFLFASKTSQQWVELIWLITLIAIAILVVSAGVLGLRMLWHRTQLGPAFFPDANGNLPVAFFRGQWLNFNFLGADILPQAWAIWQATNNRSLGTPARELFTSSSSLTEPDRVNLPLIAGSGQSEVIDAVAKEL